MRKLQRKSYHLDLRLNYNNLKDPLLVQINEGMHLHLENVINKALSIVSFHKI